MMVYEIQDYLMMLMFGWTVVLITISSLIDTEILFLSQNKHEYPYNRDDKKHSILTVEPFYFLNLAVNIFSFLFIAWSSSDSLASPI